MRRHLKCWPALILLLPSLITHCIYVLDFASLPVDIFPNKLEANVDNHPFFLLFHF